MKRLSDLFHWLSKEFGKNIVSNVVSALVAAVVLLLPTALTLGRSGLSYLRGSRPVPGWSIPLSIGLLLMLAFLAVRERLLRRRLEPRDHIYQSHGLEWVLHKGFWQNFRHFNPDELSHQTLVSWIKGPFCLKCKRAVDPTSVLRGTCSGCGTNFGDEARVPALDKQFPYPYTLLLQVFIAAQGDARRKEIP